MKPTAENSKTDIPTVLEQTLENVIESIDCDSGYVVVRSEIVEQTRQIEPSESYRSFYRLGDGNLNHIDALRIQQVVMSEDTVVEGNHQLSERWVGIPIRCDEGIIAVLVFDKVPAESVSGTIEIGEIVASQTELVVDSLSEVHRVRRHARRDDLTGVFNRRYFIEIAEREMARARRYDHQLSLLMLDLDHFKDINDTHGHAIGDTVLVNVVERVEQNLRTVDILGRYGGEEFLVLLPETSITTARKTVAERLKSTISCEPVITEAGSIEVTASFGVAALQENINSFEELLDHADEAMYQAKSTGRNCIVTRESDGSYRRAS